MSPVEYQKAVQKVIEMQVKEATEPKDESALVHPPTVSTSTGVVNIGGEYFTAKEIEKFSGCAERRRNPLKIEKVIRIQDDIIRLYRSDGSYENFRLINLVNLGYSEWVEIQDFYQGKSGKIRDAVMSRLQELYNKAFKLEKIPRRNVLDVTPQPKKKKVIVKKKPSVARSAEVPTVGPRSFSQPKKINIDQLLGTSASASTYVPAAIDVRFPDPLPYILYGDTSLPPGVQGYHGKAIEFPVHGMFFQVGDRLLFQRSCDLPQAEIRHLVNLRHLALISKDAGMYSRQIAAEMMNRGLDPNAPGMSMNVKEEDIWED